MNGRRQKGNPMLQFVRVSRAPPPFIELWVPHGISSLQVVRYEWGDCAADIQIDGTIGVVFLVLSYHKVSAGVTVGGLR